MRMETEAAAIAATALPLMLGVQFHDSNACGCRHHLFKGGGIRIGNA